MGNYNFRLKLLPVCFASWIKPEHLVGSGYISERLEVNLFGNVSFGKCIFAVRVYLQVKGSRKVLLWQKLRASFQNFTFSLEISPWKFYCNLAMPALKNHSISSYYRYWSQVSMKPIKKYKSMELSSIKFSVNCSKFLIVANKYSFRNTALKCDKQKL